MLEFFIVVALFVGLSVITLTVIFWGFIKVLKGSWDPAEVWIRFATKNQFAGDELTIHGRYLDIPLRIRKEKVVEEPVKDDASFRYFTHFEANIRPAMKTPMAVLRHQTIPNRWRDMPEVVVGDADFDDRFALMGADHDDVYALFSDPTVREALLKLSRKYPSTRIEDGVLSFAVDKWELPTASLERFSTAVTETARVFLRPPHVPHDFAFSVKEEQVLESPIVEAPAEVQMHVESHVEG